MTNVRFDFFRVIECLGHKKNLSVVHVSHMKRSIRHAVDLEIDYKSTTLMGTNWVILHSSGA